MVPIVINANENFDDKTFSNYLMKVCHEHQKEKRALIFAFIVYDFEDYTINQILESHHYWSALDRISGYYISIFYVNSRNSYFEKRQREIELESIKRQSNISGLGLKQFLLPVELPDTTLDKSIKYFKKVFNIEENFQHPFILFFQVDRDSIIDYFIVSLNQDRLEEAFLEIKRQINNAVIALKRITPENYDNHKEIFEQVKLSVQGGNIHHYIKTKITSKISVKSLLSFIKMLTAG